MKPLRIDITNFGAIAHTEIDLRNITLAAICGPNGSGKSTAFTIAPRFALFGATKFGTGADDMVRTGSTEAAVTFDFEHQGSVWRVARTRSTKGRGKSTLELQRQSGELWASQSGASIAETQKKIIDLLNLDDETFVASSMILQGDASNFTSRPAGQRKAILSEILQLDQYENLQEKARGRAGDVNLSLEKAKAKMADIDTRLAGKAGVEKEKLAAEIQLAGTEKTISQEETDLQTAQVELAALVARIQQADEIGRQVTTLRDDIGTKTVERDRQQTRLTKAQQLIAQENTILGKVNEYENARDSLAGMRGRVDQREAVYKEAARAKDDLTKVDAALTKTNAEILRIESNLKDQPRLEVAKAEYDAAVSRLAECQKLQAEDQRLRDAVKDCTDKLMIAEDRYISRENSYKQQIASLESKTTMLANANCVDIERAQCRFLADAVGAKEQLTVVQDQYAAWKVDADQEIVSLQSALKAAQEARTTFGFNPLEPYDLQEKINRLQPDVNLLSKLSGLEPLLANLKTQRADLETRQADLNSTLDAKRQEYKSFSEGLKQLPELRRKMETLAPWLKMKEQLPAAKEIAATAREIITRLDGEIATATVQADKLQQEYKSILGDAVGLKQEAEAKVQSVQDALKNNRDNHTHLTAQLGGLQAKLDALTADEQQRVTLAAEMEPLAKELVRWQTLVKAFGHDGIPAMIIENAVPELERIANDILGQMSGGRNYLRFETQRELKSRSGMAETLDIIVGDWSGERIYETFSGGEQLRIDFAIRFALAELLTRRAGARVDWLTIDEGFGSQSEEFLPMVIDAVKNVAHRFGMVLVISHVREVQEAFDQRIEFRPATEEGAPTEVKVA